MAVKTVKQTIKTMRSFFCENCESEKPHTNESILTINAVISKNETINLLFCFYTNILKNTKKS